MKGTYHSLSMTDPQRPDNPLVVDIQEKHDILAHKLLQNSAKAGDIPLDTSAILSSSLSFPDILII
jgi:hypothetical protein